jgi:hypothetical protein
MDLGQKNPSKTGFSSVGAPKLIWQEVRTEIKYCGLDDEFRGKYDAIRYAKCDLSEEEFTEMYKNSSDTYRVAADATVLIINMKAGK